MIKQLMEKMTIKTYDAMTALYPGRKKRIARHDELLVGTAAHLHQPKHTESLFLSVSERLQHSYILGASGSGKSTLLYNLITQDIQAGRGFCLIDPHGDLTHDTERYIAGPYLKGKPPEARQQIANKLVLIDPACREWVTGFNPLEAVGVDPYAQAMDFV